MQRWTHRLDDDDDVSLRNIDAQNLQRRVAECVRVCVRACLPYLFRRTDRIHGVSPPSLPRPSRFTLPVRGFSVRCEHAHPRLACLSTFIYLFSPHHLSPCGGECPLPADVAHWRGGYVTADEAVIWRGCWEDKPTKDYGENALFTCVVIFPPSSLHNRRGISILYIDQFSLKSSYFNILQFYFYHLCRLLFF